MVFGDPDMLGLSEVKVKTRVAQIIAPLATFATEFVTFFYEHSLSVIVPTCGFPT